MVPAKPGRLIACRSTDRQFCDVFIYSCDTKYYLKITLRKLSWSLLSWFWFCGTVCTKTHKHIRFCKYTVESWFPFLPIILIIFLKMDGLTVDELARSAQEKGFTLSNKNPGRVKATYRCSRINKVAVTNVLLKMEQLFGKQCTTTTH